MDSVSKEQLQAEHEWAKLGKKVYRLVRAIKDAYVTRLYGPFKYAKARKTTMLGVAFWYFLLLGNNPLVVGPFSSKFECNFIRTNQPVECPNNADCAGIPLFASTQCWSDGR